MDTWSCFQILCPEFTCCRSFSTAVRRWWLLPLNSVKPLPILTNHRLPDFLSRRQCQEQVGGVLPELILLLFNHPVVFNSLHPYGLEHTSLPCPLTSTRASSNSCPSSRWCHPTISCWMVMPSNLLLLPSIFPSIRVFSNESVLHIRWTKYWSFSFSIIPSNEYSGLISFRINWFDLLAVQGTLKSLLQHHSSKASVLQHSAFFLTLPRYNWYIILFKYKTKCQFGNLNK